MATVYVLGAGASMALHKGMLTMKDLNKNVGELVWHSAEGIFPNIKNFVLTNLPQIVDPSHFKLESVLAELDNIVNNKQGLGNYTKPQIDDLRAYLLFAINEAMSQSIDNANISVDFWYKTYQRLILKFLNSMGQHDSIVTLNYDTILDGRINDAFFIKRYFHQLVVRPMPLT
jgi:hypothetical protein